MTTSVTRTNWNDFDPVEYLKTYYDISQSKKLPSDEIAIFSRLLKFLNGKHFNRAVEVGCGPTIHHAIIPVRYVNNLLLSDFVLSNLDEVRKWLLNENSAFDWDTYIRKTLELEQSLDKSFHDDLNRRKHLMRQRIIIRECNITKKNPLGDDKYLRFFDLLMSYYCADSATSDKKKFSIYISNILSLLKSKGSFIFSMLEKAENYTVGDKTFPSMVADELFVRSVFERCNVDTNTLDITSTKVAEFVNEGFSSILIVSGKMK